MFKKILSEFNIVGGCKRLDTSLWECPQMLFLASGFIVILIMVLVRAIVVVYTDEETTLLIMTGASLVFLILFFIISKTFERIIEGRQNELHRAAELLRLKDQFVFIAAHELRSPATAIRWGLSVLNRAIPDVIRNEQKHFDVLEVSSNRLLHLVQDLLESARAESGTVTVDREVVILSEVASDAAEELRGLAEKMHAKVENNIPADIRFLTDPTRLKEVFVNLISNSLKYGREGGVVILSAKIREKDAVIDVSDNGYGISQADQKRIFEKFWRSDEDRVRTQEGTGLGLFIVQKLVELLGGEVWFKSEEGKGTIFSFTLLGKLENNK